MGRARACMVAMLFAASSTARAEDENGPGRVTIPLPSWEAMLTELESEREPDPPAVSFCSLERRVDGVFSKGLFHGTLVFSFRVLDDRGHVRVPVIDGSVSVGDILLNGVRTSLLREGDMYTLGVERPGIYEVRLEFFSGEDVDRFARRLHLRLPEGGATHVSILVPERDIEARLAGGALTRTEPRADGTAITGNLDASGLLDLSWTRRATHRSEEAVKIETSLHTLFTVGEALISGTAAMNVSVIEGETDVVELVLPPGLEVVEVEGDAVLQWRTDAQEGGRLTVLLRYLVSDRTSIRVQFQLPSDIEEPVDLLMPLPAPGTPMTGTAGVQGPAGLSIRLAGLEAAEEVAARDLPSELTDLTRSPMAFGFRFEEPPIARVAVARRAQVELTSTVVEEIQASTVLAEDGAEVTKLKLRIRNNTREYLAAVLPEGAVLTHSLVDGQPVRPAVSTEGGREALLLPLRQSERIGAGTVRSHAVRSGETLSDIANFYFSDPTAWQDILAANPDQLYSASSVAAGQVIRIPARSGVSVEESSFVIEIAYKRKSKPLGSFGETSVSLPELDVDAMRAIWHLYFPASLDPIAFDANLTQYSAIRYDPFRRARDFLDRALWVRSAWAGGKYENILAQRKVIYREEAIQRAESETVRGAFPLVGRLYRFKRILLGHETPRIEVSYVDRDAGVPIRWGAMIAAFALTLLVLSRPRDLRSWAATAAGLAVMLVLAHYVLGVHRRIVWGADLALIVSLVRLRAGPIRERLSEIARSPWRILEIVTFCNLALVVGLLVVLSLMLGFPLLVSSISLVVLALWWRRKARLAREEVRHVQ